MNQEKGPSMPSSEEMAQNEKERTLSDAELIKDGAEYKINEKGEKRLDLTDKQIEGVKEEMEISQESREELSLRLERSRSKYAKNELKEVFAILERHLRPIESELSPKEKIIIECNRMQNAWEEAYGRMNDEEIMELNKVTTEDIEKIEKYLENHKDKLTKEGKFFLGATIELRKAIKKRHAMETNSQS